MLLKEFDSYQGAVDHAALNNLKIDRCVVRRNCDKPYLGFFQYADPIDQAAHDAAVKRSVEFDRDFLADAEELQAASEIYDQRFTNVSEYQSN